MKIIATGFLTRGEAGTSRAALTFSTICALTSGELLATVRTGSTKDAADETIELYRSHDSGQTWQFQERFVCDQTINGASGSLKLCYLTELAPRRLIAAAMWVDRTSYPDQPLFNPETEGCLPMSILLADSHDDGRTWTPWRHVRLPEDIGPASLTNPILQLPDGRLAMSIETNKHYYDQTKWWQQVMLFHSHDGGTSWGPPQSAGFDPSGRIFNWDQRYCLTADGTIAAFTWTYDSQERVYRNIHRKRSTDGGMSWSEPEDLGFADQAGVPALLPGGRVLLPFVDRFGTHSIRARLASAIDAPFNPETEVVLYSLETGGTSSQGEDSTGALLDEMSMWTFGLPFAAALSDGDVLVMHYASSSTAIDIRWARIRL